MGKCRRCCRKCCTYFWLHPKIILKIMLIISTICVIYYGFPVDKTVRAKNSDDRFTNNENVLHMIHSFGYNDYKIVHPILITTYVLCVVGWIGALINRTILMQIFTWYMFACGVTMFLLTICTYGGEMYMQRKIALAHLDQKWEALIRLGNHPYAYSIGVAIQKSFQCCGRYNPNDWNHENWQVTGGYVTPDGCCSSRYGTQYNCEGRANWGEGCYDAIRRVLMEHVSAIRVANLLFCFHLFHAASWGAVLTLEVLRTWVPPPPPPPPTPPEERARKQVAEAEAIIAAELEAEERAERHMREKEQRELEDQERAEKKLEAMELTALERAKQKGTAEEQAKEDALRKARERDEKEQRRMREAEERALERAKQKEKAEEQAKEDALRKVRERDEKEQRKMRERDERALKKARHKEEAEERAKEEAIRKTRERDEKEERRMKEKEERKSRQEKDREREREHKRDKDRDREHRRDKDRDREHKKDKDRDRDRDKDRDRDRDRDKRKDKHREKD